MIFVFVHYHHFYYSEAVESRSTSPQIYSAPVPSQSQTSNPLATLTTPAVSLGSLQSQVNCTPYNSFQPQITSFLHQFEQFANNKSVCINIVSNGQMDIPPIEFEFEFGFDLHLMSNCFFFFFSIHTATTTASISTNYQTIPESTRRTASDRTIFNGTGE